MGALERSMAATRALDPQSSSSTSYQQQQPQQKPVWVAPRTGTIWGMVYGGEGSGGDAESAMAASPPPQRPAASSAYFATGPIGSGAGRGAGHQQPL